MCMCVEVVSPFSQEKFLKKKKKKKEQGRRSLGGGFGLRWLGRAEFCWLCVRVCACVVSEKNVSGVEGERGRREGRKGGSGNSSLQKSCNLGREERTDDGIRCFSPAAIHRKMRNLRGGRGKELCVCVCCVRACVAGMFQITRSKR